MKGNKRAFPARFSVVQTASHNVPSDSPRALKYIVRGEDVFVAAAGQVNHQQLLFFRFHASFQRVRQSMGGSPARRNNPFMAGAL